ncbi:Glucose oxidase; AltName: Full=Beta-D-glucose:oxygen 1-oxido-reductase; AltName: Full=Glucose oxyhydrase; Short=GOD; Flags: Precursor [Serendipita indica DSM 11827]|uniref:Related to Glucose oxidase n=1 Tax=Serendipita indica (strain DSM 11827) TaxID=1109443 RepID=G4TWI1_SERID|nr:Glucose oxidase; AltName: Full=Beta-D-glucose:oxygen 1-oxido-reductase; AltName: Full=Glucose oxyhydrase; Short=GOD; Flags: Precursor [Serendipita indica DSM 11827]CCA75674.1 related to Glucose oxidase [Serendipita indica DSM 11827]
MPLFLLGAVFSTFSVVATANSRSSPHFPSGVSGDPLDASNHTFDYIVVGGGLTGLALAGRLSEDAGTTVLVIEAGGDNRKDPRVYDVYNSQQFYGSDLDWSWPVDYGKTGNGGKTLGGSSSINGATWTRGAAAQYDAWSDLLTPGERSLGWNWSNLYSYMKKAEHYHPPSEDNRRLGADGVTSWHGTRGPVHVGFPEKMVEGSQHSAFITAIKNITGIPHCRDLNGGYPNCVAFVPSSINPEDNFHRSSSAMSYLTPVENTRKNWLTLVNSTVFKLVWKPDDSKTVIGVEFLHLNNSSTVYRANVRKEVIMAAGSINTPAILQRSGVGDPALLSSLGISTVLNLPTVGKNLQEQTLVPIFFNRTYEMLSRPWSNLLAFPNLAQLYGKNATAVAAEIRSSLDSWADSQKENALSKAALKKIYESQADVIIRDKAPVFEIIFITADYIALHGTMSWVLLPFSRGSVKIKTTDPFAKPNVTNNFFSVAFDTEMQAKGAKLLRKLFNTPPLSNLTSAEYYPGLAAVPDPVGDGGSVEAWDPWLKAAFSSNSHALGTCSMMRKDLGGVVDGRLRVYGAKNLRVTDASVMPTQVSSHMMSTLYGIAEKLADMIKAGL